MELSSEITRGKKTPSRVNTSETHLRLVLSLTHTFYDNPSFLHVWLWELIPKSWSWTKFNQIIIFMFKSLYNYLRYVSLKKKKDKKIDKKNRQTRSDVDQNLPNSFFKFHQRLWILFLIMCSFSFPVLLRGNFEFVLTDNKSILSTTV